MPIPAHRWTGRSRGNARRAERIRCLASNRRRQGFHHVACVREPNNVRGEPGGRTDRRLHRDSSCSFRASVLRSQVTNRTSRASAEKDAGTKRRRSVSECSRTPGASRRAQGMPSERPHAAGARHRRRLIAIPNPAHRWTGRSRGNARLAERIRRLAPDRRRQGFHGVACVREPRSRSDGRGRHDQAGDISGSRCRALFERGRRTGLRRAVGQTWTPSARCRRRSALGFALGECPKSRRRWTDRRLVAAFGYASSRCVTGATPLESFRGPFRHPPSSPRARRAG
jgi:hypothetical protein